MCIEHVAEGNLAHVLVVWKRAKTMRLLKRHFEFGICPARGHFVRALFDFALTSYALVGGHAMGTVLHEDIGVASKMIRGALRGNRNWGLILHAFDHVANRKSNVGIVSRTPRWIKPRSPLQNRAVEIYYARQLARRRVVHDCAQIKASA